MRDLDLLLEERQVLDAQARLLEHGAAPSDYGQAHAEAALELLHHLPPIYSPSKMLAMELHFDLFHDDRRPQGERDPGQDEAFWARRIQRRMAGETIDFASPTDLLLHLIQHAVYGHTFNNGPLTLSDLAYLLDTHEIDWPLFWQLNEEVGYVRGAHLALTLVERYCGDGTVVWPPGGRLEIDDEVLAASAMLMLRDMDTINDIELMTAAANQTGLLAKLRFFRERLFISRAQLALIYPVSPTSPWIYLYYPRNWWRFLTRRIPRTLKAAAKGARMKQEVRNLSRLNDWLQQG